MGDEKQREREKSRRHRGHEDKHRKKRRRGEDGGHGRHRKHESRERDDHEKGGQEKSLAEQFDEDMWEEKPADTVVTDTTPKVERQTWMTGEKDDENADPFSSFLSAPAKEKQVEKPKPQAPVISSRELNTGFLNPPSEDDDEELDKDDKYVPPTYTIGDDGSSWRMMKLKNIYTAAKESMKSVEEVAVERMGSLRAFDEAREEEQELDRRKLDRRGDGVKKLKITGTLHTQRLEKEQTKHRRKEDAKRRHEELYPPQRPNNLQPPSTPGITQSDLNRLQADLLRAEMTGLPNIAELQKTYESAIKKFNTQPNKTEIIVLPASHSVLLPHLSRETSKSDADLTIEDMLREERASKRTSTVDRIARDRRFKNDLDYMDENAERLAAAPKRKEIDLKSMSVQEYKKQQEVMEKCPLCYKDDGRMPLAAVVSLGTRVYLSLPTEPELTSDGAMIVPLRHAKNLAECDDDEWEEIRVRTPLTPSTPLLLS
jgi:Protein similar to CwfJ C-terminus 1